MEEEEDTDNLSFFEGRSTFSWKDLANYNFTLQTASLQNSSTPEQLN